ncbi:hypothetical protein AMJ57_00300 [Parcubacteria bacterium SG8_24]|nr:MAG: hypothetical protein AMJ57_00300 [Parcubacteria bacterium SG8_24]
MENRLPEYDYDNSETGCCPKFDPQPWDGKEFRFEDKLFAEASTVNFLHMPLNMGSVITKSWKRIEAADARPDDFLLLSYDPSPWRGKHYFAVTKDVPGMEMVRLTGTFLTKVFEGPYKDAGKWVKQTEEYVKRQGKEIRRLYFFYTTCPKCAQHYGKNYTVAFAQIV